MKVTYNWLKNFVDIDVSAEELAKKLTGCGMEVEELIYQNAHLHHVVVGQILKIERHPQADKLVVCQVNIGSEITQIITAATNVFEGAIVPVSLPGADLVNGIQIQKSKLRGMDSCGMFCSGAELGIDENYIEGAGVDGILILPKEMIPGTPIEEALHLNDIVFDIGVTPNRADCMSVVGIAREVCALLGKPMKQIDFSYAVETTDSIDNYIKVQVTSPNCYRYMAAAIKDVQLKRSPIEIRSKLYAVGIKPINTLVDITNYVLVEMGQPLHAFDQNCIGGRQIEVRQAKSGEKISVLNHNTYALTEDMMVIADKDKPMVIAGIIGGTNSCINETTNTCILEGAVFDLKNIRITSKKIGVRTDSSARYEKGVFLQSAEDGLKRALHLISVMGCGKIVSGLVDIASKKSMTRQIQGSVAKINEILGLTVPGITMKNILTNLGIQTELNRDALICQVPPYREDIENNNDLAEEVIRMYGYENYDNLDISLFEKASVTEGAQHPRIKLENKMKDLLVDFGFYETVNYALCSSELPKKLFLQDKRKDMIAISNPISEDISCMRTAMAHALFSDIVYNLNVGNEDVRLFEIGRIYLPKSLPLAELPEEQDRVAVAVCEKGFDFFHMKGVIEGLLSLTSVKYRLERSKEPYLHPGISADIIGNGVKIGCIGQIHPSVAKMYELPSYVLFAELDTDFLAGLREKKYQVKPTPKYPIVDRDLAVIVTEDKPVGELLATIKSACGKLFYHAKLFDVYRSDSIGTGNKSIAFRIRLVDEAQTLTEEVVSSTMQKVLKALEFKFGAKLR